MEHFLPQSDIRTENHKMMEIAGCQLSLRDSVVKFADVMLRFLDISNKYPDPNTRRATLITRTLCFRLGGSVRYGSRSKTKTFTFTKRKISDQS